MRFLQVTLVLAAAVSATAPLHAQEDTSRRPERGFFRKTRVSFWGDPPSVTKKAPVGTKTAPQSIWAEPMRLPDGRMSIYMPPPHIVRFLEDPSDENGKAYLAVQIEKNLKMMRAQEVLARLRKQLETPHTHPAFEAPTPPAPELPKPSAGGATTRSMRILYFKSDT